MNLIYKARKLDNETNFPEPCAQKLSPKCSQSYFPKSLNIFLEIIFSSLTQGVMVPHLHFLLCYRKYKEYSMKNIF